MKYVWNFNFFLLIPIFFSKLKKCSHFYKNVLRFPELCEIFKINYILEHDTNSKNIHVYWNVHKFKVLFVFKTRLKNCFQMFKTCFHFHKFKKCFLKNRFMFWKNVCEFQKTISSFFRIFPNLMKFSKTMLAFFRKRIRISKIVHISKNIQKFIIITLFLEKLKKIRKMKKCFECYATLCS